MAVNPATRYLTNYVDKTYVQPLKNANSSGLKQAKEDTLSTKALITTALSTGIGAAVAKPKTPQQAVGVGVGMAIGMGVSAAVGYVDGFGKSLGFWGKK